MEPRVHISRRDRYAAELENGAPRTGQRLGVPRFRDASAAAEALFDRRQPAVAESPADEPPRTGRVKWFNDRQGYGFVTLEDGVDAFLPARALRGEEVPPVTTVTVRTEMELKGLCVVEVIDIDLSTAKAPVGDRTSRREFGEVDWTATGTIDAQDWRGTYGFVTTDDGKRVFVSGAVVGKCGIPTETIVGKRVEIGVTRTDRGPAVAKIRII